MRAWCCIIKIRICNCKKILMKYLKLKTSFLLTGILMLSGLFLIAPVVGAAATVDAAEVCGNLSPTYKKKCETYIATLNKCAATDSKCQDKAFTTYQNNVCGTSVSCMTDTTKLVPKQSLQSSGSSTTSPYPSVTGSSDVQSNPIIKWLKAAINLLAAVIGIGSVVMIIVAGIQYSAARDNPQAIQSAKQKIVNVVIALASFIFLWAFMQWLIPGGAF